MKPARGSITDAPPGDLVFLVAAIIAVIIIAHIVFTLLNANTGNDRVCRDADWAAWFATWFLNLFTPAATISTWC